MSNKKGKTGPREIALLVLNQYFKKRKSLKNIINKNFKDRNLSGLDRRFIFNIVKGTVRYYIKIDFILSLFSDKDLRNIDFIVLNILRMGIYQLMYMDRVPDYSALDESVKLAKKRANYPSSKFVNAALRKISSVDDINLFFKKKIKDMDNEALRISKEYSYPEWLVDYWLKCYGREKTILILKSLNENPLYYLRFNRDNISPEELAGEFELKPVNGVFKGFDITGGKSKGSKNLFFLKEILDDTVGTYSVQEISESEIYKKGLVTVQDISSQLAVKYFLRPRRGDKVLDVCAAPGGKTSYIAQILKDKGELVSVDISSRRLELLRDSMERLGLDNVKVVEADAGEPGFLKSSGGAGDSKAGAGIKGTDIYREYFDSILIDAPCSAFGTISKNPDAKYNKSMDDVIRLSAMSYSMMVNCDRYLKTGGKLIFYTCTLSPAENQNMIERFLKEFRGKYVCEKNDFIDKITSIKNSDVYRGISYPEGCLEIMPYYFESEAGFVCCLRKNKAG
ncbi:MAG: 16S rRNA (cytosine(967)-C(5))-methyltransferase RsmB [Actinomycetota bacterium]|nr:16S rRNA (cytosine(967)-C(5))-methyltransferase RsmB [Actinomycetota bacterium]